MTSASPYGYEYLSDESECSDEFNSPTLAELTDEDLQHLAISTPNNDYQELLTPQWGLVGTDSIHQQDMQQKRLTASPNLPSTSSFSTGVYASTRSHHTPLSKAETAKSLCSSTSKSKLC